MTWKELLVGVPLAILGAALLLVTGVGMTLARTDWGRAQVRQYVLRQLNAEIAGRVEIDGILPGDLLRRVGLAGLRIYEPGGTQFASADTLIIDYRWWDFLFGNVVIPKVILVGPRVELTLSRAGSWNAMEIFRRNGEAPAVSEVQASDPPSTRSISLREVLIRAGDVEVRLPYEEGGGTDGAETRWHIESGADGLQRVVRLESFNATLPLARVQAPPEPGRLLQIVQLNGLVTTMGDPIEVEQLRADLQIRGDTLSFDVWEGVLPGTHLFGQGWVKLGGELGYDISLRGNPVDTRDLRWLDPRLPEGTARLDFRIRSSESGLALEAQNARWESPDARLSGQAAITLTDAAGRIQFDSVNLQVERLSTGAIESLMGSELPLAGDLSGRAELAGRLRALSVDADLRFRPEGIAESSRVKTRGVIELQRDSLGARALEVTLDTLRLDDLRAFLPELAVRGRVNGTARLDGLLSERLAIQFDLEQHDRTLEPTRLRGGGTIALPKGGEASIDVTVEIDALSLATVATYYPTIPFRGDFRGRMRAVGSLSDLGLEGRLAGLGDSLRFRGRMSLAGETPSYQGELWGTRVRLAEFRAGFPQSDLDFHAEFEGHGAAAGDLQLNGRVDLFASFIGGIRFDSAYAIFDVAEYRVRVDTAVVVAEFGRASAGGALALKEGMSDSLAVYVEADSLSIFNHWLNPERLPLGPLRASEDGPGATEAEVDILQGSATLRGWLVGRVGKFTVRAGGTGSRLTYGDWSVDSLSLRELQLSGLPGEFGARGAALLTGVEMGGAYLTEASLVGALEDTLASFEVDLTARDASAGGRVWLTWAGGTRTFGIETLAVRMGSSTWQLEEAARLRLEESGALAISGLKLTSGGRVFELEGSVGESGPVSLKVNLTRLDLAKAAGFWPDTLGLSGVLSLQAELSGRVRNPIVQGSFEVVRGRVLGVGFSRFTGSMGYEDGQLSLDVTAQRRRVPIFRLHGTFPIELRLPRFGVELPDRPIRMALEGDSIPLALVSALTDQVANPRGFASASILVRGSPSDVSLVGQAEIRDGRFRTVSSGIHYQNLSGRLEFRGDQVELQGVSFNGRAGGRGTLSGTIGLESLRNPTFDLELVARELPAYNQLDARLVVSGNVRLSGPYDQARMQGRLTVVSGVVYIDEFTRRSEIVDPFEDGLVLIDAPFSLDSDRWGPTGNVFLENLTIALNIALEHDTWLRSAEANVEIAGTLSLQMNRAEELLRLDGTLRAVRGDYRFLSKRFEVIEGSIEFVGTGFDPNLRIVSRYTAQTQKRPLEIRLVVEGTLKRPTLRLESDAQPPIPESDLLSYLLFGRPSYELTRSGTEESSLLGDVASGVPQAFFGYALGSLLVEGTGIAYVDVSQAPLPGAEDELDRGDAQGLTATQVEVGWYLAPTVFVSVAQHLVGAVHPTVRVEWRLDERLTLLGVTEPRFGQTASLFSESSGTDLEQSVGLFLFYGWSY